jgi:5,5'-dehydrodivanillate O-demethylase
VAAPPCRADAWRDIGPELPCNFLQIMENSVDPHHVEWLHGRYGSFLKELGGAGRCRS